MAVTGAQSGTVAATLTGARAKVYVNGALVGIATDCNWTYRLGMEPVHVLGNYGPSEIVPVSQEAVDVTLNGMRVFNLGPHTGYSGVANTEVLVPVLSTLLTYQDIVIDIVDRQNLKGNPIMRVAGCRSTGYSSSTNAKGMMTMNMTFTGIRVTDENATDAQIQDAGQVPYKLA